MSWCLGAMSWFLGAMSECLGALMFMVLGAMMLVQSLYHVPGVGTWNYIDVAVSVWVDGRSLNER